jgi:radical SAM enzyme (TIGR01210 family)
MRPPPTLTDHEIVALRGPRNQVDPWQPYAALLETEPTAAGIVENVATLLLTNRECPFRCLMCDLWKNTTPESVPVGAVASQVRSGLTQLGVDPADPAGSGVPHIKLYNSGNFFDRQAISLDDRQQIAEIVAPFKTVIVENHPRLCDGQLVEFQQQLSHQLEIAIGLETIHPQLLPWLNKRMTLEDFDRAADLLQHNDIQLRCFVLLKLPFMEEQEAIEWALKSVEYAFAHGAGCVAIIPLREGNGAIDQLRQQGSFHPPQLASLEQALALSLQLGQGRVWADLWDLDRLPGCPSCRDQRRQRLEQMNESQKALPLFSCPAGCQDRAE